MSGDTEATKADRLAEIKALHERLLPYRRKDSEGALVLNCTQVAARLMYDGQAWLIAEVERLRAEVERLKRRPTGGLSTERVN